MIIFEYNTSLYNKKKAKLNMQQIKNFYALCRIRTYDL